MPRPRRRTSKRIMGQVAVQMQQLGYDRAHIARLLVHANDQAVLQQWQAGRVRGQHQQQQLQMSVTVTEPAVQQLLGLLCNSYTVCAQLPADAESVMGYAAGPASSNMFQPSWMLAPHNSKPNSGTLRKQAAQDKCHQNGQAALKYDFSGISSRFQPQKLEEQEAGHGQPIGADDLSYKTIRIEGTCTITHPANQAAAAVSSSNSSAGVDVKVIRWLVLRESLPDNIQQQQQQQVQELERFRSHEQEQEQLKAEAEAAGRKHTKKAYKWSGTPMWWVPYELYVPEGSGWVGGIALYEFTGQLVGSASTGPQASGQQHQAVEQGAPPFGFGSPPLPGAMAGVYAGVGAFSMPYCGNPAAAAAAAAATAGPAAMAAATGAGDKAAVQGFAPALTDPYATPASAAAYEPQFHDIYVQMSTDHANMSAVPADFGTDPELLDQLQHQQLIQQSQSLPLPDQHALLLAGHQKHHQQQHQQQQQQQHFYQYQQQQHQQGQLCCSREQKHMEVQGLAKQLQMVQLQDRQLQQAIQQVCLQQPCLPQQQCSRRIRQLNASCTLIKSLLQAVCGGYCGGHSVQLFRQLLLQLLPEHNAHVEAAALDGAVGTDRLLVDALTVRGRFGRSLLHFLVSEHPLPEITPEVSLQLGDRQQLEQHVAETAAAAQLAANTTAAAAAAGGGGASGSATTAVASPAEVAAAARAAIVSSSCHTLDPHQRMQLLQLLREVAVQQGRWLEVLRASNSSGATAWLTACHWCIPKVLEFFLDDPDFDLQLDMLHPTKNGRLFYHVICREAHNREVKTQHEAALRRTLAALADKLTLSPMVLAGLQQQQQQQHLAVLQHQHPLEQMSAAQVQEVHSHQHMMGLDAAAALATPVLQMHQPATDIWGLQAGPAPLMAAGSSAAEMAAFLPYIPADGNPAQSCDPVPVTAAAAAAAAAAAEVNPVTGNAEQTAKRQKLSSDVVAQAGEQQQAVAGSTAAAAAAAGRGGGVREERSGGSSGDATRQGSVAGLWSPEVLQALQQQYIFHTDRPSYDVALLEGVVQQIFGFEMQRPHGLQQA